MSEQQSKRTPEQVLERPNARELIAMTLDDSTFRSWNTPLPKLAIEESYRNELEAARAKTGEDESVITGEGLLNGTRVVVVVGEFGFLGGSIGVNAATRMIDAIERATAEGLPVLAAPISGGTRMQEGTRAFLQMVKITEAVVAHKAARLPYLVYLRHPTTGGVFASWGSLGHITVAQTGALVGFLGPKVYKALHGTDFPAGVQTAENLFAHGIVDAVLDAKHLRIMAGDALAIIAATSEEIPPPAEDAATDIPSAWESITISRRSGRPGLRSLLRHAATSIVPLSGTGQGESNKSAVVSLATIGGRGTVVVGLDRRAHGEAELGPDALRQARRGMALAAELGLPLITVVDTPGAALSREAEEGGLGGEIARCLAEMLDLPVPTIAVILGEGTGGGALALLPADRVIAARHGWLAPLPPEGASVIMFGDTTHAPAMTVDQRVRSQDLLEDGIVHEIVEERPAADQEPAEFCRRVGDAIVRQLAALEQQDDNQRRTARSAQYSQVGF
ncbi:carboxyl transferase domain-containing protein [Salinibacterium sp. NK8237]|uniref:carboxyl transferase domain-containing protein n=1 Tax=Salinibacterium sp. NK8237 TaxID=2792038 RepID=UPI0018CD1622|nr:carboxyl transferase domain-containing protein [Salinibacterium sp. NK8237]MBH0130742.1 acetyl-CoA carboxylase carboxyltransferase subunit alpha/beta [Salinibacterium sp. NK8237]